MRTAIEVLDWAVQYKEIAGDGFNAEMLWLAQLSGNQSHEAVQGLTFSEPEWLAFACKLDPVQYQSDWVCTGNGTDYNAIQKRAVCAFKRGVAFDVAVTGDLNERTHKVIWRSGFGTRLVSDPLASVGLHAVLIGDISNDDRAKVYLALVLLGENASQPIEILTQSIQPETYHEILCVLVANLLKDELQ